MKRPWFGDVHRRGEVGQNRYALTFDDGPLPGATDRILDQLKALDTPATFFVVGLFAEQSPDLVRRMHGEGHVVANHTWDHWRWGMWCAPGYWREQIVRTDDLIEKLIGRRPAMFRPPYGVRTPVNHYITRTSAHANIMWTRRAFDGVATTAGRIEKRLLATAADGDVLVLHDGRETASSRDPRPTVAAVPGVIAGFRSRGLRPVLLHELLNLSPYQ